MEVTKRILSNGVRTLCVNKTNTQLDAVKIFVKVGSQDDNGKLGITHFLEHLLFQNENTRHICYQVERYGGIINANTTRDYMAVYVVIPSEYTLNILSLLLDVLLLFEIDQDSLEQERGIVLQEILSHQNSNAAVWDLFMLNYWEEHPIRYPIRGYVDSINSIHAQDIILHYTSHVDCNNIVISYIGALNEENFSDSLEQYFETKPKLCPISSGKNEKIEEEVVTPERVFIQRNLKLTHCFIAFQIPGYSFCKRHYFKAISKLLADGSFSRLYSALREKNKLVYSVTAQDLCYAHAGVFLIYTKALPEKISNVEQLIDEELHHIVEHGIPEDELAYLKTQYKGQLLRSFETVLSVCSVYGIEETLTNTVTTIEESIEKYNAMTSQELRNMAQQYLFNKKIIIIGNHGE